MNRIGLLMIMLSAAPASAQLIAARTHAIAMGHHHVMVEDMEKNMSFWKSLGGETVTFYDSTGIKFPNVLIFFREQKPTAGTNGAVVNHVGLQFKDLRPLVKRLRSAGTPIITNEVVGATMDVDDDGLAFNEAADLGGVNLTFSPADRKLAPTKGRALDHIGFEVDGLEALCKKLEAEGFTFESPYERIPERKIAHATLIDPWGTQIESTEGLAGL